MRASRTPRTLTLRELNRATLARQLLLHRATLNVVTGVERLAALQAQWSPSPYFALWSRLAEFRRERLWSALERHTGRCIAAFGPVSLADIAKFAGQVAPRLRPTLEALAPKLRAFKDEAGRTLYDLPTAPRPAAGTRAPARFLPRYDEVLIAYQNRERIVSSKFRSALYAKNGIIEAALLIDGMVAATWSIARAKDQAVLEIHPLTRIAPSDRADATTEGERLVRFAVPEARSYGVRYR